MVSGLNSVHRQALLRSICDDDSCFLFQPAPQISMGPSSGKQYDPLEELDALEPPSDASKATGNNKKPQDKQTERKTTNTGGGSWFGGLFSKLTPKPKNQMILPDDNNPKVSLQIS